VQKFFLRNIFLTNHQSKQKRERGYHSTTVPHPPPFLGGFFFGRIVPAIEALDLAKEIGLTWTEKCRRQKPALTAPEHWRGGVFSIVPMKNEFTLWLCQNSY
jgi:hypothetical protein